MNWEFNHNLNSGIFNDYLDTDIKYLKFTKENIPKIELKFQNLREVEFSNCKFENVTFYYSIF